MKLTKVGFVFSTTFAFVTVTITSDSLLYQTAEQTAFIRGTDITSARVETKQVTTGASGLFTYNILISTGGGAPDLVLPLGSITNQKAWTNSSQGAQLAINQIMSIAKVPSSGGGGQVDSVVAGTGIDVDSSDPANPVVSVEDTAVTPGSYTLTSLTVDQQGRITAASSGAIGGVVTSVGATAPIASSGGTTPTISHNNSGVAAATYGSATQSPQIAVDAKGHITSATDATITPAISSVTGLGAGVATFLGTPSSANLASAVTDEVGSGSLVFAISPALTTPNLGIPSAATLTNATGLPPSTGLTSPYGAHVVSAYNMGVPVCLYGTSATLTNMANALAFLSALMFGPRLDLTGFTDVKFQISVSTGSASANTPKAILRYFTSFSTTTTDYLDIGTSEVSCSLTTTGVIETAWIPLAAGAIGSNKYLRILVQGGDGAADPVTGLSTAFFR